MIGSGEAEPVTIPGTGALKRNGKELPHLRAERRDSGSRSPRAAMPWEPWAPFRWGLVLGAVALTLVFTVSGYMVGLGMEGPRQPFRRADVSVYTQI